MKAKAGFDDLRQRLDAFAARFAERARPSEPRPRSDRPPDTDDYWRSVQELFTRDVTEQGLRELVAHETQDTFRYFSREIDFAGLTRLSWYKRYPLAAWKVYLAVAFRLSPARRVVFAAAAAMLALGWLRYLIEGTAGVGFSSPGFFWVLVAATVLFGLLILELRDKLVLKGDLEIARQIQFGLLPFEPYEREGVVVCAAMRPANTVGGDYFDVIEIDDGRVAVAVADVAGKGMPAALLMALLQGSLRTLLTAGFRGAALVGKLNAHLQANIPANRLVTLFYAEFDPADGRLAYVNAGHNAPFLLHRTGVERLRATDVALGVVAGQQFQQPQTLLDPGDRLFVYTDGVTEAFDARDHEYGDERLAAMLASRRHLSNAELLQAVQADVLAHCGSVRPHDDMTMLVLARRPAVA
jgi:hypothetical protein